MHIRLLSDLPSSARYLALQLKCKSVDENNTERLESAIRQPVAATPLTENGGSSSGTDGADKFAFSHPLSIEMLQGLYLSVKLRAKRNSITRDEPAQLRRADGAGSDDEGAADSCVSNYLLRVPFLSRHAQDSST